VSKPKGRRTQIILTPENDDYARSHNRRLGDLSKFINMLIEKDRLANAVKPI